MARIYKNDMFVHELMQIGYQTETYLEKLIYFNWIIGIIKDMWGIGN